MSVEQSVIDPPKVRRPRISEDKGDRLHRAADKSTAMNRTVLKTICQGCYYGARVMVMQADNLERAAQRDEDAGRIDLADAKRRDVETLRNLVKVVLDWRLISSTPDIAAIWDGTPAGLAKRVLSNHRPLGRNYWFRPHE